VKPHSLLLVVLFLGCSDDPAQPAAATDAALDTTPSVDSGEPADTFVADADADAMTTTCVPDSFHPPHPREAKCTDLELSELHDACLGSTASTAACNAFRAAHLACFSCFLTTSSASAQGALTQWDQTAVRYIDVNVGGCLSLLAGDSSATSCGAKWDAWNRCAIGACCASTPFASFQSCVAAARTGGCKDLKAAYDACLPSVTNGKMCTPAGHSTPRDLYLYAGKLFCQTT